MKSFGEGKALIIAITTSTVTMLGTFGLAAVMRSHQPKVIASMIGIKSADAGGQTAQGGNSRRPMELAAAGRHLFLMNCAHCHGDDARGDEGPDLHDLHKSDARVHQVITAGIKGEMPSFTKKLSESDIQALTAYLRTLS
ncbi:MAG: ccoP [Spartobacteria bacterium]|nr:ccoP [Spartobacteria bacterium]